jgi:trimethylamine--corrinoid protein Co-methyltransferase
MEDLNAAMEAVREVGPAGHFLGTAHTLSKFERAFFMPSIMDFNSYEQWSAEGSQDAAQRALAKARSMLEAYQEPKLEESKIEALEDFIARRERELPATVS